MPRLTSIDLNKTFSNNALAAATGDPAKQITVELLAADPALTAGEPRAWINTTTGTMKFSHDGVAVKVVTAA